MTRQWSACSARRRRSTGQGSSTAAKSTSGRDGGGVEHDGGVAGGDLGHLVDDQQCSGRQPAVGQLNAQAGDRHRLQPHGPQLLHRLVGGGQPEHRAARLALGHRSGVHRRRLAVARRGDHCPQRGPGRAQLTHCFNLVVAQGRLPAQARLDHVGVDTVVTAAGEMLKPAEDVVLQRPVLRRRPPRRLAPLGSDSRRQPHCVGRGEERFGQLGDLVRVPPAVGQGAHRLVDVGLGEAGPVGAHADVGVDQVGEDLLALDRRDDHVAPDDQRLDLPGSFKADGAGLGLPRLGQQRGGELVVLGAAGGERRRVVGPHSLGCRLVLLAPLLQLGLDLGGAL
jgi:hypothetical protein